MCISTNWPGTLIWGYWKMVLAACERWQKVTEHQKLKYRIHIELTIKNKEDGLRTSNGCINPEVHTAAPLPRCQLTDSGWRSLIHHVATIWLDGGNMMNHRYFSCIFVQHNISNTIINFPQFTLYNDKTGKTLYTYNTNNCRFVKLHHKNTDSLNG